jgi:EAL domain-containing protein (putative c-di-GMP-specific phosphodiesterase class I)
MADPVSLRIIIVDTDTERAKSIAGGLSKNGFAVKGKIANGKDVFQQALASKDWDIILITEGLPSGLDLQQLTTILDEKALDTPLVLVTDSIIDEPTRYEALKAGAKDAVSLQSAELLGLIIQREINSTSRITPVIDTSQSSVQAGAVSAEVDPASLSQEEKRWYDRIQSALDNNCFVTVYQPIVNLAAEPAENYEILLRMLDEKGDEIAPGAFMGSAEKAGLMTAIDRWVVSNAIHALIERQKEKANTRFFIKLSSCSLRDSSLEAWLSEQLLEAKLPESSLVFEITEADATNYPEQAQALSKRLKQLNCQVALDHAGLAGEVKAVWGSLDLDYIKISGKLISNLSKNKEDQTMVGYIAAFAKGKNILTIAQFVQDATVLAFLWQNGINYIQGYYLQRPDTALTYDFSQEQD